MRYLGAEVDDALEISASMIADGTEREPLSAAAIQLASEDGTPSPITVNGSRDGQKLLKPTGDAQGIVFDEIGDFLSIAASTSWQSRNGLGHGHPISHKRID